MSVRKAQGVGPALVVDLDDTLVRADLLLEQMLRLAKTRPMRLPAMLSWLLAGRARLKERLAEEIALDPRHLPYREKVLALIASERAAGRSVILASASHARVVQAVHDHLGIFDAFLATESENLKGERKLAAIAAHLGGAPFAYAGDSAADLAVGAESERAIAINPSRSVTRQLARLGRPHEIWRDDGGRLRLLMKQIRVHQWVKNILVFVPAVAGHRFDPGAAWTALLTFVAFSLCASTVYVLNDVLDVEADRAHPTKRRRPFASGSLSLRTGLMLCPLLLAGAMTAASLLPPDVWILLGVYLVLNLAYSFKLKELLIIDTVVLSAFYTLRILAGGAATNVPVSEWLLAFSVFFFFGLAMVKRYTELLATKAAGGPRGRGYRQEDAPPILAMGVASSLLAVLIIVLYLNGADVRRLYPHWERLWTVTPILLYWSARLWTLAHRGSVHEDPVMFTVKDRVSWLVAAAVGAVFLVALY
jgi:4-hydroxybenzoate polyprenyltransferase/phosphoserine phosphatase